MKIKKEIPEHPVIEKIRKIINDKGLTRAAAAEFAGTSASQFSKIMSGDVQLSLWQLSNFATNLNMDIIDVFTYPEKYVPEKNSREEVSAMITIQLNRDKREKVLRAIFGDADLKILNIK